MIFVDTSFWVALRNQRDGHHDEATALLGRHAGAQLTTTNHVQGETWTYLRRRGGHRAAVGFLDVVEQSPRVTVARVSEAAEQRALTWLGITSCLLIRSPGERSAPAIPKVILCWAR